MRRAHAPIVIVSDSFSSAQLVLILLIAVIPTVAVYVWTALGLSAVFGKIGQEQWRAWVPIVNQVTLVMVGGLSGWFFLLILVPGVGALAFWVVTIVAVHRINRGFGLGGGMTALAAVLFPVWASVVGFGVARWRGTDAAAPAAPAYARTEQVRVVDPHLGALPADDDLPVPPPPAYAPPPLPGDAAAAAAAPSLSALTPEPASSASGSAVAPADREAPDAGEHAPPPARHASAASAWAPPPPPATPTAPVATTAADEQFAPPAADAAAPARAVPWTPAADADAVAPARVDRDFDQRWHSSIDEVSAISQPPQGDPVAARPVATGLPALVDDAGTGPERGRIGDDVAPRETAAPREAARAADPEAPQPAPAVPLRTAPVDIDPAFPAVTRAPAGPPRSAAALDPEFPLDTADEVSAVAGAPVAGAPRSALDSVAGADAPADDDVFPDHTVVARRRRVPWMLQPAAGSPIDLRSDVVIVGRQPAADPAYRTAQLVAVVDDTRTVSKTHARLELRGDRWIVTDLGSTNGVMLPTLMGTEIEAEAGAELAPGERFLLGDAAFRLLRTDG
ncbi:FHA domain-containing protein [Microbacterium sp. Sa4CUA7]|uniref:FHA domain-containing protein n=1 Tax=Microbacterium pullorum TaxID=2762236 RepID=A0ABR8S452_9MICO|nr:DUF5684 domain-containing protein [Microbacterium pullorum]MBD7958263.1 FHA domain-containing protein [Microbacterium pullorum]